MSFDGDRDVYGRHHASFASVPWRIHGRDTLLPMSALCRAFNTYGAGKHVATTDHPAGLYVERKGLVVHVAHPNRPRTSTTGNPYWGVSRELRHGEVSAESYRSRRAARENRRTR